MNVNGGLFFKFMKINGVNIFKQVMYPRDVNGTGYL